MKKWIVVFIIVLLGVGLFRFMTIEYAYTPPNEKIDNMQMKSKQMITIASKTEVGTDKQINLGKKMFFEETFGDEVFFTDIMGLFNWPLTLGNISKALVKLGGRDPRT